MSDFSKAIDYVLHNEGGFVDHPNDPGGATNMGVTIRNLAAYRECFVTKEDIKNLTLEEAVGIYRKMFWDKLLLDKVNSDAVATCIFDAAVLFGPVPSTRMAQEATNLSSDVVLLIDGYLGPMTVEALNTVDETQFINVFHGLLSYRIDNLATRKPDLAQFKKGWENRIDRILTLIKSA